VHKSNAVLLSAQSLLSLALLDFGHVSAEVESSKIWQWPTGQTMCHWHWPWSQKKFFPVL